MTVTWVSAVSDARKPPSKVRPLRFELSNSFEPHHTLANAPAVNGSALTSMNRPPRPSSDRASIVRTPTPASKPTFLSMVPAPTFIRASRKYG